MNEKIKLDKETKDDLINKVKVYFSEEREEDLGDLAAALIVDFITDELGPVYYNKGVFDSYTYIEEKIQDVLEIQK